jgi:hypothetical protein
MLRAMKCMVQLALLPLAVVLFSACSGDKVSGTVDASSETAASDGPAADRVAIIPDTASADGTAGASDAAPALPANATEVCVVAIKASVERQNRCFGTDLDYHAFAEGCPDYYFNADSNRTVAEVTACVDTLATRPCTDLFEGTSPSCLARGKRAAGAGCLFSSQCQSGVCATGGSGCATCSMQVPIGGKCDSAACGSDAFCDRNTSICTALASLTYATEGQSCNLYGKPVVGCVGDLDCPPTATSWASVCTARPTGEPCGSVHCTAGTFCRDSTTSETCVAYAALGESCGTTVTDPSPRCVPSAVCVNKKCIAPRVVGEPCDDNNPCGLFLKCMTGTCQIMVCPA